MKHKFIFLILFLALCNDFIANEKPLYFKMHGNHYFPAFRDFGIRYGFASKISYGVTDWRYLSDYEYIVPTIIPYSANFQDEKNRNFVSPFAQQDISSWYYRHWLGTDEIGKDVLSGILNGLSIAIFIGIFSTLIALIIGVSIGVLIGYLGDHELRLSKSSIIIFALSILYSFFISLQFKFILGIIIFVILLIFTIMIIARLEKRFVNVKKHTIPLDTFMLRLIDIKRSIPTLIILILLVSIFKKTNILLLTMILGLVFWTPITLLLRNEVRKVKTMDFVTASKTFGLSDFQLIIKQILPNAIMPVWILSASMVASFIVTESSLSFIGLGLPIDIVTWGSMLKQAENNINAWWLALFPGLCLFGIIYFCNNFAEKYRIKIYK